MNETTIRPAPVRRSVTVKAAQARAFQVFTDGFGRWWPKSNGAGRCAKSGAPRPAPLHHRA